MAKSIRSKCKRKARTEFRNTIGTEFHKKNQEKIQEKLKKCVDKSNSTKSIDKVANLFASTTEPAAEVVVENMDTTTETTNIAILDSTTTEGDGVGIGENKIKPVRKSKRSRKHSLKDGNKKQKEERVKRRPKYFVQF